MTFRRRPSRCPVSPPAWLGRRTCQGRRGANPCLWKVVTRAVWQGFGKTVPVDHRKVFSLSPLPSAHRVYIAVLETGPYTDERRTPLRPFIVRLSPDQTTPNAANSDPRGDARKRPEMHRNTHPVRARSAAPSGRGLRPTRCRAEATGNALENSPREGPMSRWTRAWLCSCSSSTRSCLPPDPVRQALLAVSVAVTTATTYNCRIRTRSLVVVLWEVRRQPGLDPDVSRLAGRRTRRGSAGDLPAGQRHVCRHWRSP